MHDAYEVREPIVRALAAAAFTALEVEAQRVSASAPEVGSAAMTIALHTILVMRHLGADVYQLRAAVERLLLECIDDRAHNTN